MTGAGELSSHAKALLSAARADAPSAAVRAKIWQGVASGAKLAGASAMPLAGAAHAVASSKLLVMGALFGSAVTVGLAATVVYVQAKSAHPDPEAVVAVPRGLVADTTWVMVDSSGDSPAAGEAFAAAKVAPRPARLARGSEEARLPPMGGGFVAPRVAPAVTRPQPVPGAASPALHPSPPEADAPQPAPAVTNGLVRSAPQGDENAARSAPSYRPSGGGITPRPHAPVADAEGDDVLMREATLVAEARGALARGDAAGALTKVRMARALPSRQLGPEELAIEAQALRVLGKAVEATGARDKLRAEYPDHPLAR